MENNDFLDPELRRMGEAVAGLSRPKPPSDLASRTMSRVLNECRTVRRRWLMVRPITNPVARVLAAASIMLILFPMTTMDLAAPLGARIEERITGHEAVNRFEQIVDRLLVRSGPANYSQEDLEAVVGARIMPVNSFRKVAHSGRL